RAKILQSYVPEVRDRAIAAFAARYPGLQLAPVVAVIAALDEEGGIGAVLDGLAPQACGLRVQALVIDDGSRDRTSEVSLEHGAHVARLERNCGHGIALRLGYELAPEHGAAYIVTPDGAGQGGPRSGPPRLEP